MFLTVFLFNINIALLVSLMKFIDIVQYPKELG